MFYTKSYTRLVGSGSPSKMRVCGSRLRCFAGLRKTCPWNFRACTLCVLSCFVVSVQFLMSFGRFQYLPASYICMPAPLVTVTVPIRGTTRKPRDDLEEIKPGVSRTIQKTPKNGGVVRLQLAMDTLINIVLYLRFGFGLSTLLGKNFDLTTIGSSHPSSSCRHAL